MAPKSTDNDQEEAVRKARSVVIVEDDPAVMAALDALLREEGYVVEGFADASLALARLIRGHRPGVVLLDWLMHPMNGSQFLKALDQAHIPVDIVLLTAMDAPAVEKTGRVIRFLRKPFDVDRLLELLEELFSLADG